MYTVGSDICPNASEDRVCDMVNFTIRESWLIKNGNDIWFGEYLEVLVVVSVYFDKKELFYWQCLLFKRGFPYKINGAGTSRLLYNRKDD